MPQSMPWVFLLIAGVLEIAWAIGLKYSHGFSRPVPTTLTLVAMVASMYLLSMAVRTLPVGTAYAVWTGIGSVGAFVAGILLFKESAAAARIACAVFIVAGIVGLKVFSPE